MALVIMRKQGEGCKVKTQDGKDLEVKVLKIKGKQIYLAFIGPKDFEITRLELEEESKEEVNGNVL